jgi:hypothetical protein
LACRKPIRKAFRESPGMPAGWLRSAFRPLRLPTKAVPFCSCFVPAAVLGAGRFPSLVARFDPSRERLLAGFDALRKFSKSTVIYYRS